MLFISADYRLLLPGTGFDQIADAKTLLSFIASPDFSTKHLPSGISLDPTCIAAVGESGGAYVARAAAIYGEPKPKVLLLQYGMGGQLLEDQWLAPKDHDFPSPRASRAGAESLAHLLGKPQKPVSYDPILSLGDKALPSGDTNRMSLLLYWWKQGELLDYILGENISASLRELPFAERAAAVPEALRPALLQERMTSSHPPTFLLHGKDDPLVLPSESILTYQRLKELGVRARMVIVEGASHALMDSNSPPPPPKFAPGADEVREDALKFLESELL